MRLEIKTVSEICGIKNPKDIFGSRKTSDEKSILKKLVKANNANQVMLFSNFMRSDKNKQCIHHEIAEPVWILLGVNFYEKNIITTNLKAHQKFVCKKCGAEKFLPVVIHEEMLEFLRSEIRDPDGRSRQSKKQWERTRNRRTRARTHAI